MFCICGRGAGQHTVREKKRWHRPLPPPHSIWLIFAIIYQIPLNPYTLLWFIHLPSNKLLWIEEQRTKDNCIKKFKKNSIMIIPLSNCSKLISSQEWRLLLNPRETRTSPSLETSFEIPAASITLLTKLTRFSPFDFFRSGLDFNSLLVWNTKNFFRASTQIGSYLYMKRTWNN